MTFVFRLGWGRLKTNGTYADVLQQAKMRVVDHDTCAKKNADIGRLKVDKKGMLCAGGLGTSGCQVKIKAVLFLNLGL